jgi:hypothetical protein
MTSSPRPPLADHPIYGRSLEALTGAATDAGPFASGHIAWLHRIVRVPMWALDDDDLAFLIAHHRALEFTVPLALDRLEAQPDRGGMRGPGALLLVVAATPDDFWERHRDLRGRVLGIAVRARAVTDELLAGEIDAILDVFGDRDVPPDSA